MSAAAEMFRCLEDGDVSGARAIWSQIAPHLPQPKSDATAAATLHYARTQIDSMPFKKRAYSHAWLTDRGFPSALPDELRPKAQRMYPRVVEAVGISVNMGPFHQDLALAIRTAQSIAVEHCYADGQTEPTFVKARMMEARMKVLKGD